MQDQAALRAVQNYQVISPRELANLLTLGLGQTPGRQIRRVRRHFSQGVAQLYNEKIDNDAVIENVHGKGYRLNPRRVRVVARGEMREAEGTCHNRVRGCYKIGGDPLIENSFLAVGGEILVPACALPETALRDTLRPRRRSSRSYCE